MSLTRCYLISLIIGNSSPLLNNLDMSNVLAMANMTDDNYECILIQDCKLKILSLFVMIIFETH